MPSSPAILQFSAVANVVMIWFIDRDECPQYNLHAWRFIALEVTITTNLIYVPQLYIRHVRIDAWDRKDVLGNDIYSIIVHCVSLIDNIISRTVRKAYVICSVNCSVACATYVDCFKDFISYIYTKCMQCILCNRFFLITICTSQ